MTLFTPKAQTTKHNGCRLIPHMHIQRRVSFQSMEQQKILKSPHVHMWISKLDEVNHSSMANMHFPVLSTNLL